MCDQPHIPHEFAFIFDKIQYNSTSKVEEAYREHDQNVKERWI